ncbi:MAG TPA: N-acetyl-gamma-glutamyl-phosphate reductase [Xanthomonadales bacterium]|nr:N-acetyl-gamma-glutamyl-phosphate reductase [Xanthomonadales bacterium]
MNRIVVIGGRGYTGNELVPLLWRHPEFDLVAIGSRSASGESVAGQIGGMDDCSLSFSSILPADIVEYPADAYVLALPNGHAARYVAAIDQAHKHAIIVDLSADYRFDSTWTYGLPEMPGQSQPGARRIANPGCYATAFQLLLAPLINEFAGTPVGFGVSGYSGAGRTPSRRNNTEALQDNLMPYSLIDHIHEKEVSHQMGRSVRFLPHVASFFRGISLTGAFELQQPVEETALLEKYQAFYKDSELVEVQAGIPEVAEIVGRHGALIGGFTVSQSQPGAVSMVCVLDNLLKGAATQAMQNLNLAFGLDQHLGIPL